jgi:hypothetical protein
MQERIHRMQAKLDGHPHAMNRSRLKRKPARNRMDDGPRKLGDNPDKRRRR